MLLESFTALISVLLLVILVPIAVKIITSRLALWRFQKLSKGLPMCPNGNLLANHAVSVPFGERNCMMLKDLHDQMGKTIGWLKGAKFCASTVDLDLIKTFVQDQPNVHMDRVNIELPLKEFAESIMLAEKEEWRGLRKAIAPALT